ncbi:hypothetical protein CONPUDRAFT_72818 [Coniophora puteana RWD-64-598 SS2]|uniref:Uncharacterized protein n=1 Tax=Coniophora puteana (strain RWD-64-598) TaxID=741705 RepID=A0A5M3MQG8_CONPW|nr:uncharacterized protein CONPUDRAFT_72818 [Coniophora puteana RWD-64-598 SS2]EIW80974.1 hypothetical protein CONPUDRAFT_72818 [Coniophora puteana RWD-64-598 SS2]
MLVFVDQGNKDVLHIVSREKLQQRVLLTLTLTGLFASEMTWVRPLERLKVVLMVAALRYLRAVDRVGIVGELESLRLVEASDDVGDYTQAPASLDGSDLLSGPVPSGDSSGDDFLNWKLAQLNHMQQPKLAGFPIHQTAYMRVSNELASIQKNNQRLLQQNRTLETTNHALINAFSTLAASVQLKEHADDPLAYAASQATKGPPRMKKEDCGAVHYFTRTSYTDYLNKSSTISAGIKKGQLPFLEWKTGQRMDSETKDAITQIAIAVWNGYGDEAPTSWGHANIDQINKLYREILLQYPEVGLCEHNWKLHELATVRYPSWRQGYDKRKAAEAALASGEMPAIKSDDNADPLPDDDTKEQTTNRGARRRGRKGKRDLTDLYQKDFGGDEHQLKKARKEIDDAGDTGKKTDVKGKGREVSKDKEGGDDGIEEIQPEFPPVVDLFATVKAVSSPGPSGIKDKSDFVVIPSSEPHRVPLSPPLTTATPAQTPVPTTPTPVSDVSAFSAPASTAKIPVPAAPTSPLDISAAPAPVTTAQAPSPIVPTPVPDAPTAPAPASAGIAPDTPPVSTVSASALAAREPHTGSVASISSAIAVSATALAGKKMRPANSYTGRTLAQHRYLHHRGAVTATAFGVWWNTLPKAVKNKYDEEAERLRSEGLALAGGVEQRGAAGGGGGRRRGAAGGGKRREGEVVLAIVPSSVWYTESIELYGVLCARY